MRFRKGSKVEMLSKKKVPAGSWRPAEIICGSGHYYTVRYDKFESGKNRTIVERVSRKAIRPCPPSQEVEENWSLGDVVEVFSDRCWKMATVSEVLGKSNFLVRLLGSSCEFKVSKFDIRARRSWQDDRWVLVQKRSCKRGDNVKEDMNFQESRKRGSNYENSQPETITRAGFKRRAFERKRRYCKEDEHIKLVATQRWVDVETFKDGSFERNRPSEMNDGWNQRMLEENFADDDKVTCSVGSCSVSNDYNHRGLPYQVSRGGNEDTDGSLSDAESSCRSGYGYGNGNGRGNFLLYGDKNLEAEIHSFPGIIASIQSRVVIRIVSVSGAGAGAGLISEWMKDVQPLEMHSSSSALTPLKNVSRSCWCLSEA